MKELAGVCIQLFPPDIAARAMIPIPAMRKTELEIPGVLEVPVAAIEVPAPVVAPKAPKKGAPAKAAATPAPATPAPTPPVAATPPAKPVREGLGKSRAPFEVDVTAAVKPGENVLALRVDHTRMTDLSLGGILRPIVLIEKRKP